MSIYSDHLFMPLNEVGNSLRGQLGRFPKAINPSQSALPQSKSVTKDAMGLGNKEKKVAIDRFKAGSGIKNNLGTRRY